MAPKSKFTPNVVAAVLQTLIQGGEQKAAARVANISVAILCRWLAIGRLAPSGHYGEFYKAYRDALEAGASAAKIETVQNHGKSCLKARGRFLRKYTLDETFFSTVDTPEKAYLLGFIATDGHVDGTRLSFGLQARDRGHLETIRRFLGSDCLITERMSRGGQFVCAGKLRHIRPSKVCEVYFDSKKLATDLCSLGVSGNKTLRVTPWSGPAKLTRFYWLGCIDGDGGIWGSLVKKTKTISWAVGFCGNFGMVTGFMDFIRGRLGLHGSLENRPDCHVWVAKYSGSRQAKKIVTLLYQNAPFALERKRLRAESLMLTNGPGIPP